MPAERTVIIANFLQGCSPLLSLFAYLPQWRKIIANKSSRDISLTSWLVWLLSVMSMPGTVPQAFRPALFPQNRDSGGDGWSC